MCRGVESLPLSRSLVLVSPCLVARGVDPRLEELATAVWGQRGTKSWPVRTYEHPCLPLSLGAWQLFGWRLSSPPHPDRAVVFLSWTGLPYDVLQQALLSISLSLVTVRFKPLAFCWALPLPSEQQLSRRMFFVSSCHILSFLFWSSGYFLELICLMYLLLNSICFRHISIDFWQW